MFCTRQIRTLNSLSKTFRLCVTRSVQNGKDASTTLSHFQQCKILQEFDHVYDRNKDGYICTNDTAELRRLLMQYYMTNRAGPKSTSILSGYDDYWTLFREVADANKDEKLSRKEWVDIWAHIIEKAPDSSFGSLPTWVRLMPQNIFQAIDIKSDGVIDFEEYQNFWFFLTKYDCKYTTMKSMFNKMTEDGHLKLDMKRFEELYADYYLSSDPESPGKYIAGPVEKLVVPPL